jgi:hypothetical protein
LARPPGHGVVDGLAIALAGTGDVVGRLGAAFDLERVDADFGQLRDVFDGAQVFRIEDVAAVLVFLDRHVFPGTLLLLQQPGGAGAAQGARPGGR